MSLGLIDDLELQIARLVELNRLGADHRYIPLLITGPRVRLDQRVHRRLAIANIERFASRAKLCGYTGLCPRVIQSGNTRPPRADHQTRTALPGSSRATS